MIVHTIHENGETIFSEKLPRFLRSNLLFLNNFQVVYVFLVLAMFMFSILHLGQFAPHGFGSHWRTAEPTKLTFMIDVPRLREGRSPEQTCK